MTGPPPTREPLSSGQQRLWFINRYAPDSVAYNCAFAYRLDGPLDVGALEGALAFVRDRHDALRTRFAADDGVPYQLIGEPGGFRLPVVDVSGGPTPIDPPWPAVANEPFDLSAGAPVRIVLYRLAATEHVLLVCVHHIIFDGWSQGIFVRDLSYAYAALVGGGTPHLPAQLTRYADYVRAEQDALTGDQAAAGLAYWRQRLAGAPDTLDLRIERPHPNAVGDPGAAVRFAVPTEVVEPLRALARRERATLYMVALAGYAALLSRYAGEADVVVGAPAAGRTRVEWEGLVGFFVNTLPLRIDLSADPRFVELVRQTRDAVLGGLMHAAVPFERLVQELAPARDPDRNAIFQTWCDMFPPDPVPAFGSVAVRPVDAGTKASPFDLSLHLTDGGGPITGRLLFQPKRFDPPTMRRFTEHYRDLLAAVAADPDRRVPELPILPPAGEVPGC